MWPWEHAAVGYTAYSLFCRLRGKQPDDGAAVSLLVGTQMADLIDKPLAWGLGVLPAGRSLGHSLLFVVPCCVLVYAIARHRGSPELGVAFGVGYLLHLPADLVSPMLHGGTPGYRFLLWPLIDLPQSGGWQFGCERTVSGVIDCLLGPLGPVYLIGEAVLLGTALLLWWADGLPGLGFLRDRSESD